MSMTINRLSPCISKGLSYAVLMVLLLGCSIQPQPIRYGTDGCHYCSMTIVDNQHASQIVTTKGKAFKFDAIECLLNDIKDKDHPSIALFLVNDYDAPGALIDATEATFLISEGIPSPMGEYLTAFGTKAGADGAQAIHNGQLFNWDELLKRFRK